MKKGRKDYEIGMLCAILCALIWGVLPLYWNALDPINPLSLMLCRLTLLCILVFIADLFLYKWKGIIEPLKKPGAIRIFILDGILIAFNWGMYIFMVNNGYVLQTSIGYYIDPLVICIFGVAFFKERMERYKLAAFLLACVGVAVMIFSYGTIPYMALLLAFSFATYAAVKKKLQTPALLSLFYETIFLLPVVIPAILYLEYTGRGIAASAQPGQLFLLCFSGLVTAVPLALFAMAANRISMIALGITEYISPSMGLLLGIFYFHETFDLYRFIGFALIWAALAIFTVGGAKESIRLRREAGQDA